MRREVKDFMTRTVVCVEETTPYKEIVRLLDEYRVNALPVVDPSGVLVGIVTEADLILKEEFAGGDGGWGLISRRRRRERTKATGLLARDVMSSPVITTTPEANLAEVARMLHGHGVKQVPVTNPQGKVVGIVSRRDLLRVFLRTDEAIRREVVDVIIVRTLWLDRAAVRVMVREGVVTLEGQLEQRSLAEWLVELVGRVEGVVGIDDRLTSRIDDTAIRPDHLLTQWGVYAPGIRPITRRSPRDPATPTRSG